MCYQIRKLVLVCGSVILKKILQESQEECSFALTTNETNIFGIQSKSSLDHEEQEKVSQRPRVPHVSTAHAC